MLSLNSVENRLRLPTSRAPYQFLFGILFLSALTLFIILQPHTTHAGQATLTWTAPTTNTNGTPLTDLAGYKVYYGTASESYSSNINVGNVTTYTVSNLTGGLTYYFAVTAYDTSGFESAHSNEVSKTTTQQYTLTTSKGGSGAGTITSSPSGISCGTSCSAVYNQGTIVTLTASPATGSTFTGWSGGGCTGTGTCSFSVTASTTVTATFANSPTSYTITASAGSGGTISPSGAVTVSSGASKTFTITPNTGYSISGVTVDGSSVGAISSYTFSNVTTNHTMAATFAQNTYTVTPSAGANGSISPSTAQTVNYNATTAFTVTPNSGYSISSVTGCGGILSGSTYTTGPVIANCTVTASFGINTYTITTSAGSGGTISPSGAVTVSSGASKTFTITPNTGYSISDVAVDGLSAGPLSSYTFTNVTGNHTISASFAALDSDGDGVPDMEEWGPLGNNQSYDGNNDGIPDYLQNSVASLHTFGNIGYITLYSPDGHPLKNVKAEQIPAGSPQGASLPYQFISFVIDQVAPGSSTTAVIILPQGTSVNNYYKYGPTPDNTAPHWYSFLFDGQTGAEISGNIITLHFLDGLRGDDDLTANGQIVDQGGPAQTPVIGVTPSSLAFSATTVNTTSSSQIVTVSNAGLSPLAISTVTITGTNAADFVINGNTCSSQNIAPSGTCTISVAFSPHTAGNRNALLTISSDAPDRPVLNIPLSGTGNAITNFVITATAGSGGSISPSGSVTVSQGANTAFTITPKNATYRISDIKIDGVSIGALPSKGSFTYTFVNVSANHSIAATFGRRK